MDFLSYFALFMLIFVIVVISYGIIAIHDNPYLIAKKRDHPHQDAIHSGGWVSLFTLHAIWPFLWLWATAYHPEHGYMGRPSSGTSKKNEADAAVDSSTQDRLAALESKIADLEAALNKAKANPTE